MKIEKITVICDRCKEEIPLKDYIVLALQYDSATLPIIKADLCNGCEHELVEWLKYPEKSTEDSAT